MMFLLFVLAVSVFLNFAFIFRFLKYNGEFYINDSNPDDVKPVLKMDLDEWSDLNFIVIRHVHNKDISDKERK